MRISWSALVASAAVFSLTLGCNKADPLSPNGAASFATGGSGDTQKAQGSAVLLGGLERYTFVADTKKGVSTGHLSWTFGNTPLSFIEGDIVCLFVVPETTHARISAIITSTNLDPSVFPVGAYVRMNFTDGGNGMSAPPDGASRLGLTLRSSCLFDTDIPEESNDQVNILLKP